MYKRNAKIRKYYRDKMREYYADPIKRKRINRLAVINAAKRRRINQAFIADYLRTHPCIDCGERDIVVLEFDHVRGKKKTEVTRLLQHGRGMILREINKCVIRCCNCHRRKTIKEQCSWKRVYLKEY